MPKFLVSLDYVEEIEADDEETAEELFWENTVYDTQSDCHSFLANNLRVKQIN